MGAVVMDFAGAEGRRTDGSCARGEAEDDPTARTLDLPSWEAFLVEFDQHATRLLRLAVLLAGGDHHSAEDLVQETFVATYPAWRDGTVDNLSGYLRRALANRVTSAGRRHQLAQRFRARRSGDDRGPRRVDDQVADHISLGIALEALPPGQRAAVVLRYYEGLSVAECAEHLDVSVGTIKSQTSDALSALRRALEASR
jgi:RNA polymerase sigma-70 factor (sigma-E family)